MKTSLSFFDRPLAVEHTTETDLGGHIWLTVGDGDPINGVDVTVHVPGFGLPAAREARALAARFVAAAEAIEAMPSVVEALPVSSADAEEVLF